MKNGPYVPQVGIKWGNMLEEFQRFEIELTIHNPETGDVEAVSGWTDIPEEFEGFVMWSLYQRSPEGLAHCIGDFFTKSDAQAALEAFVYSYVQYSVVKTLHGMFFINPKTGHVFLYNGLINKENEEVVFITQFDLKEWEAYWKKDPENVGCFNVSDLSYWSGEDNCYKMAQRKK